MSISTLIIDRDRALVHIYEIRTLFFIFYFSFTVLVFSEIRFSNFEDLRLILGTILEF